jgi:ABC-type multidrug transport system ATPase subunit
MTEGPLLEARDVVKRFGSVIALCGVSLKVHAGEVHCLLGDNGAGKSTLIKTLSGVHPPTQGQLLVKGEPVDFGSPRDALDHGIATVFQDLALIPLMSIARNFFLGREPVRRWGPISLFDRDLAANVTREEMAKMGIEIRDPDQAVGTLSGGERQCIAIAARSTPERKSSFLTSPHRPWESHRRRWSSNASIRSGRGVLVSSSSRTMCVMPWRSVTGSQFSTGGAPRKAAGATKSRWKVFRS